MKKLILLLISVLGIGMFYLPTVSLAIDTLPVVAEEVSSEEVQQSEEEVAGEIQAPAPIQNTSIPIGNKFHIRKEIPINSSNDDIETNYSTVNMTSTGLDLNGPTTYDTYLRFAGVKIPQGARLTNAYLIFTARTASASPTNFKIFGEVGDSAIFSTQGSSYKARQMSNSFLEVQTPGSVAVNDQLSTGSILPIIEEITSVRDTFSEVVIKIVGSHSGSYIARSYESSALLAPKLVIEYDSDYNETVTATNASSDDAEEYGTAQAMITSGNLEIGGHFATPANAANKQQTGIRFNNIDLPEHAEIEDAYIEFVTATTTTQSVTANLEIRAETGQPETYNGTTKNISNRIYGKLAVPYKLGNFVNRNEVIRTPNLSNLINENRLSGWTSGGSLAFKISGDNFVGSVYPHGASNGPKLVIRYRYNDNPITFTDVITQPSEINQLYINEVSAEGSVDSKEDWVELYNNHDQPILLRSKIALTSKTKQSELTNILIPAKGFQIIYMDEQIHLGNNHGAFTLGSTGTVNLVDGNLQKSRTMDSINYVKQKYNQTYGRKPDGSQQTALLNQPSFGYSNNQAKADQSLTFSKERGVYKEGFQLELVTAPELTIKYTLDGSEPSETKGQVYTAPLQINQTTVVKAYAFNDHFNTGVTAQTYILENNYQNEKINGYQWRYKTTITSEEYATAIKKFPIVSITSNLQTLSLTDNLGTFEYIDGHTSTSHGNFFSLSANKKFGQVSASQYNSGVAAKFNRNALTKKASYPFFEEVAGDPYPVVQKFSKVELKEGQDGPQDDIYGLGYNRYDEKVTNTLAKQMNKIALSARYVNYFYNGNYLGVKTLREDFGEKMFEEYFGGSDSDYTKIRFQDAYFTSGIVEEGDMTIWPTIKQKLATKNFQEAKKYLDVEDFIKTQILFMFVDTEREIDCVVENAVLTGKPDAVKMTFNINDTDGAFHNNNYTGTVQSPLAGGGGTYRYKWNIDSTSRRGPGGIFALYSGDSTNATAGNLEFKTLVKDQVLQQIGPAKGDFSGQKGAPLSVENVRNEIQTNIIELDNVYKLDAAFMGARRTMYQDWLNQKDKVLNQVPDRVKFSLEMWSKYNMAHTLEKIQIVKESTQVKLINPNPGTEIYFTLDGSDPMGADGVISPLAIKYTDQITISNDSFLTIRAFTTNNWGPLAQQ